MSVRLNPSGVALMLAAIAGAAPLGGCAGVGDSFASVAFIDPAKYDLSDCKFLQGERVALVKRAEDKQAMIDKARTGAGGAVIGEVVYRNDYIALRAQKKLADEAWQRNGCEAVTLPPLPAAATPMPAAVSAPVAGSPGSRAAAPLVAPASSATRAIY